MAELPRYRPLGLAIPSVPTVDFTMAGRARARAGDAVAKGLDAMGDYVYKRQVAQTKREAAKYSFENPVTAEQIQDAIAQGRDLEEIVGDPDTVFGSITTATAAQQLTTELTIEANKKISSYSAMVEAGQDIDISAMQRDLAAMIDGHSETIAAIDPAQGLKYSASVNASASTAYKSALENKLKIVQTRTIAKTNEHLAGLPKRLKNILTQKDVDIDTALGNLGVEASTAIDAVIATGSPEYAKTQSKEIPKMVSMAKIGVLLDYMKKPGNARSALAGNFGERNNIIYATLNDEEKALLRKSYIDQAKELMSLDDAIDRRDDAARKKKIESLTPQITAAIRERKFEEATPLIQKLEKIDPDKADKYFKVIETDGGIDVADRVAELDTLAMKRQLTEDDILQAFTDREITRGTMDRLFGDLQAQRDKRFTRAVDILSDFYGRPELLARGKFGKAPENLREFAKHRSEIILKLEDDAKFDPVAYAKQIIEKEKNDPTVNPEKKALIDTLSRTVNKASMSFFGKTITDLDELIAEVQKLQANPVKPGWLSAGTDLTALGELLNDARELQELRAGK